MPHPLLHLAACLLTLFAYLAEASAQQAVQPQHEHDDDHGEDHDHDHHHDHDYHGHHHHHHHGTFYYVLPPRYFQHVPGVGRVPLADPWRPFPHQFPVDPLWGRGARWAPNLQFQPPAQPRAPRPAAPAPPDDPRDEILRRAAALEVSTPGARARADRLLSLGDKSFGQDDYRRALARYLAAIDLAPDYPEPRLRAGHAYIATNDPEKAMDEWFLGFQLAATTERPGFALADLYRGNRLALRHHLDRLGDAALAQPNDGGLLFLIGVSLHYDGQPFRARPFFEDAAQMPGVQQHYAAMFLPVPEVAEAR